MENNDQLKNELLKMVKFNVEYWQSYGHRTGEWENAVDGVAFSIMAILDGKSDLGKEISIEYKNQIISGDLSGDFNKVKT